MATELRELTPNESAKIGGITFPAKKEFLNNLKSDTSTSRYQALRSKISEHIKKNGSIEWVDGVFGDTFRNMGFVEDYIQTEKGICSKFYGCSCLFKGRLNREAIDSGATMKRVLMATIKLVFKHKFSVFFWALIHRKKAIRDFVEWFIDIYEADYKKKVYKSINEFSSFPQELVKSGLKIAQSISLEYPNVISEDYPKGKIDGREYRVKVEDLFYCLGSFFQNDFAYGSRGQDVLSNLNKEALLMNPRKEIIRLFDLALSRENQIKDKIILIKKIVMVALLFPLVKRLAISYLLELDLDKIKPDEADRYFLGRRESYNFGGKTYQGRKEETDRIDKENGNVIIGL